MDESDYNALFDIDTGTDIPENTPAEGQETAQEAAEAQEQGENTSQAEAAQEKPAEGQEKPTEGKKEQTPEERARQAEGRRRREAEEAGRKAAMQEMNEVIARLGLSDPATGEAVDTAEKLKAYEAKLRKDRFAAGKPTEADIDAKVKEALQAQNKPAEQEPTAIDPRIQRELDAIKAMDPEMTDLGAILHSEAGEKFRGYVSKGLGFLDAYKLAAEDRLASLRQGKAAEAARLQAASKDHLSGTKPQGVGAVTVPKDVEAEFRVFFPDASAAEIQRMYAADQKKMKR